MILEPTNSSGLKYQIIVLRNLGLARLNKKQE